MTLILFALTVLLLAVAIVDRWRRRPVLVVSTHSGESVRGRRALSPRFALDNAELLIADAADQALSGRLSIPRRNVTLVQALPPETPSRLASRQAGEPITRADR